MDAMDIGPLYEEVGRMIADDLRGNPEGAFMYAEVGNGYAECTIYKETEDRVIYKDCGPELFEKLHEIWGKSDPKNRWVSISYTISSGKFNAVLGFPEEINPNEFYYERINKILKMRFKDKKIDYSDP